MKALRRFFLKLFRYKDCSRCGKTFRCRVGGNCWCDSVNVSRENLAKMRRCYMDCLCYDCLVAVEAGQSLCPDPKA
ncbi:MAG: cysteine-rich CWC family protein [Bacteroidia bacterium]|nr:cysteine-rich CWC family protein [Bacteroidia bacterium]MCC6769134.1 cysteine-rich CWC family protein [Bacteroidia bacterium]